MTIENVTKQTMRTGKEDGGWVEYTQEALSSVEVGQDAKGNAYVKSVKVYHADVNEAVRLAVKALNDADALLHLVQLTEDLALAQEDLGVLSRIDTLCDKWLLPRPVVVEAVEKKIGRPWAKLLLHEKMDALHLLEQEAKP